MKIGIAGCRGRVGSLLVEELLSGNWKGLTLAGGTALPAEIKAAGKTKFFITPDAEALFKKSDAVIDFTVPKATRLHAELAAKHKTALIVGTTGLTAADEKKISAAAKKTAIVRTANFSVCVNVLEALVEKAAAVLGPGFDIEITEAHHKHKVDAPSGTALMLGKAAARARKVTFDKKAVLSREGITGARKEGQIGFSTIRGGDAAGEHTVYFLGDGERLELKQQASNRALYARGALRAAQWTRGKKPGIYSMRDVLGI